MSFLKTVAAPIRPASVVLRPAAAVLRPVLLPRLLVEGCGLTSARSRSLRAN